MLKHAEETLTRMELAQVELLIDELVEQNKRLLTELAACQAEMTRRTTPSRAPVITLLDTEDDGFSLTAMDTTLSIINESI